MKDEVLVERSDGRLEREARQALRPEDHVVFDGPGAFDATEKLQQELMAEIECAGGLENWRARQRKIA